MRSINLYWYKIADGSSNYGDELNYFIVRELSGKKINHIPYPYKWYKVPFVYLNNLLRKKGYASFKGMFNSLFARNVLFAIGSILQIYDRNGITVWGSGIIKKDTKIYKADFKAVRGLETIKRLEELNYKAPNVFGDPALLMPLLIEPIAKKYRVGIVPNYKHNEELFGKLVLPSDCCLIDLRGNIQSVTELITSCDYILSTSLHGLIVAHAYEIPALWVDLNLKTKLAGDDTKFKDYFSSVGIDNYQPISINFFDESYIEELMNNYKLNTLINSNLKEMQRSLLNAFPFELKKKYHV
ncbi:hypothetical protein HMPREF9713_00729 [Myroides odoratimimus CCUG 12700]|uniref:polysaccharide pyruvyl transferase family protein n=1 Tax=Myroides odoratimimus TaxID=76832 RepID=UPI00035330E1|nr:polysaccharide pyruvyl transferase family protein [Myroides odoratimimus]EPH13400.1 hypothetical protein HMPREF9713_00729 [Myroides odoratimimus CCUG 12700]